MPPLFPARQCKKKISFIPNKSKSFITMITIHWHTYRFLLQIIHDLDFLYFVLLCLTIFQKLNFLWINKTSRNYYYIAPSTSLAISQKKNCVDDNFVKYYVNFPWIFWRFGFHHSFYMLGPVNVNFEKGHSTETETWRKSSVNKRQCCWEFSMSFSLTDEGKTLIGFSLWVLGSQRVLDLPFYVPFSFHVCSKGLSLEYLISLGYILHQGSLYFSFLDQVLHVLFLQLI